MAPKTAMKAMKTATKGPKSVKPTRATAAKGKSKNAKDKSNKSVTDEFKIWDGEELKKIRVAKKIREELKKKPAAAPEKSKKDESELAPTDRLTIWITPDRDDLEESSEWSSPSQYHMQ